MGREMAEPATTTVKVTLLAALAAVVGPLAAQYSLILAGAVVGAIASVSMADPDDFATAGAAVWHGALSVFVALVATPFGVWIATAWSSKQGEGLAADALWALVAFAISGAWLRFLQRFAPWAIPSRLRKK